MAGLTVTMTADEADLFAKLTALTHKTGESEKAFAKASAESKAAAKAALEAAQEQQKSARIGKSLAEQLIRESESLEEQYQRQKKTLQEAMQTGVGDTKKLQAGIDTLEKKFKDLATAEDATGRKGAEAIKEHNRQIQAGVIAVRKLDDQHDELKKSIVAAFKAGKISSQEYQHAIKNVGTASDEAKVKQTSMLTSSGGKLAENIAGWVSVAGAIRAATLAMELYREERERGAAAIKEGELGLKDLATVSDNQVELIERTNQARSIQTTAGIGIDKASELIFKLDSAGLISKDKDTAHNNAVAQYFGNLSDITEASPMISLAAQAKASFGIGYEKAVNIGLGAAEASPEMNPAELAKQIAEASRGTSLFHSADALKQAVETASLTSILSNTAGTSSGNIVKGGAVKLAEAYKGDTVFDAARKAAALSPEDYQKQFGDNENVKFLIDLVNTKEAEIADFNKTLRQAADNAGTTDSIVSTKRSMIAANPDFALQKFQRIEEQKANVAAMEAGRIQISNEAAYTRAQADVGRGMGFFSESLGSTVGAPMDRVGNYIAFGTANTFGSRVSTPGANPEYTAAMQELYEKEQREAERRHQEMLRANKPPLVSRPGEDR